MSYTLGKRSRAELEGVHPDLIRVIKRAIQISAVDFGVIDGIRLMKEQLEYVRQGVSKTLESKHLPQADGLGHAGDLVPYINGKYRWELKPLVKVARAMKQAAEELDINIRWGGCWQKLNGDTRDPEQMVLDYIDQKRRQGRKPFVDTPHYELVR